MKATVVALAASLVSIVAVAGEATVFNDPVASTRTRAEVIAEVKAAIASGERLSWGEAQIASPQHAAATRSRMAVVDEARQARARGELNDGEATLRGRL